MTQVRSGDRVIHTDDLHARAARAASAIIETGVEPGGCVALLLRNDFAFFEMYFAAQLAGIRFIPLNWHLTATEIAYILEDSDTRLVLVHADLLPIAKKAAGNNVRIVVVPTPEEIRNAYALPESVNQFSYPDWNDWLDAHEPIVEPASPPGSVMLYTSGTTGNPKGVRRAPQDAEQQRIYGQSIIRAFNLKPGMNMVVTGPLYHAAPLGYTRFSLELDCDIRLLPRFDPEGLLALIESDRLTHMHMVPIMFVRLLRLPQAVKQRYDLSSLESVLHGAAPCPEMVKRQMIDWWGPIIREYYGSTEASISAAIDSAEWLQRPGTVGRALPRTEIEIHDDDGNLLGPHQSGEIYVRSEVAPGFEYHNRPEERDKVRQNGFMTNGDMGYLDEAGYLFIADRRKDMILSGGVNIYPAEIEAALMTHPRIADCAVFAIPDEEFGERVAAAVQSVTDATLEAAELREFLHDKLARFKIPREITFHESLPRLDNGKVYKQSLRAPYWNEPDLK